LAEGEGRCQLDRTGEPDALRAHATPREMPAGDFRVFCRHADVAPARRIILAGHGFGLGYGKPAATDAEIDGGVELRIIELHQHIAADDPELGGAKSAKCGHIEAAHLYQREFGTVGAEAELSRCLADESSFGNDTCPLEER
jgi:hypothetical protein